MTRGGARDATRRTRATRAGDGAATSAPDARRDAPRARGDANALSRACFAWVTPFLRRGLDAHAGRAARLEMGDLLRPPEAYVARRNADGFERAMLETLGRAERATRGKGGDGGGGRRASDDDDDEGKREGEGEGEGEGDGDGEGAGWDFARARLAAVAHVRGGDSAGDVF